MKILEKKKKKLNLNFFFKIYFFISIILITIVLSVFVNTGPWIQSKEKFWNRVYFNGLDNYLKIHKIFYQAAKSFFWTIDEINLSIPHEKILILENDRKNLIKSTKNGFRAKGYKFEVIDGTLINKKDRNEAKIRLKGDRDSHYSQRKNSSYKVDILKDKTVNGLRKFSLMKPRARNYIYEWLYHELAGEGGLIKLKYDFINLRLNGESQGLYVIEEMPDKNLVERNNRRNGPIFSLDEDFSTNIFESNLELYNKKYWTKSENLILASSAKEKMNLFLKGDKNFNQTFDLDKWAWLLAITDLTYTYHGLFPYNVKFYYNPLSGLFEPIAFDGHRTVKNFNKNITNFDERTSFDRANECTVKKCLEDSLENWLYKFFFNQNNVLNKRFYNKYLENIKKISNENFLNNFFLERKKQIKKFNSFIYSDYYLIDNVTYGKYGPGLYFFSYSDFFYRADVLKKKFEPKLNKISIKDNGKKLIIRNNSEINNNSLKISKLSCDEIMQKSIIQKEVLVNIKINFEGVKFYEKKSNKPNKCTHAELIDLQTKEIFYTKINFEKKNFELHKSKKNIFKNYFDIDKKKILLKKDSTIIDEDIYIPGGYTVIINSGQKISLIDSSFIFSDSAWIVDGKSKKISIGGNKNNFGGGLVIKNANIISTFNNVEFKYLSGLGKRFLYDDMSNKTHLIITEYDDEKINNYIQIKKKYDPTKYLFSDDYSYFGALNFYNTIIKIKNSNFLKISSEDALNVISSEFKISNTTFSEINSDAIDIDFGNGEINDLTFNTIGNDGIDFSGSNVILNNIKFDMTGDKGVSVGEKSNISINNMEAKNLFIGIASKDGSITKAKNINFDNVKIPFASYQKKKSYNFGYLEVDGDIKIKNYIVNGIRDANSSLIINQLNLQELTKNIIPIIYKKKIDYLF